MLSFNNRPGHKRVACVYVLSCWHSAAHMPVLVP